MANSDVEAGLHSNSHTPFIDSDGADTKRALNDGGQLDNFTPMSLLGYSGGRGIYMIMAILSKDPVSQLPRNMVLPPASLQRQLFPFIENMFPGNSDWITWIDNSMMTNRRKPTEEGIGKTIQAHDLSGCTTDDSLGSSSSSYTTGLCGYNGGAR